MSHCAHCTALHCTAPRRTEPIHTAYRAHAAPRRLYIFGEPDKFAQLQPIAELLRNKRIVMYDLAAQFGSPREDSAQRDKMRRLWAFCSTAMYTHTKAVNMCLGKGQDKDMDIDEDAPYQVPAIHTRIYRVCLRPL